MYLAALKQDIILLRLECFKMPFYRILMYPEVTFHPGHKGYANIQKGICVYSRIVACIENGRFCAYTICPEFCNCPCDCADIHNISRCIPGKEGHTGMLLDYIDQT